MWTAADRAKALEHQAWTRACCRSCGSHPDWWDPKKGGHREAMVADARRCPGCEVLAQLDQQIPTTEKGVHTFLRLNRTLTGEGDQP